MAAVAPGSEGASEYWVDRGGTFTDIIARHPDGQLSTLKLPSHDPARPLDAAIAGIRQLHGSRTNPVIVKMGTTVATNALLERRGARTLLLVTQGFADALRIGHQARPDIFARHIILPEPLAERIVEVPERIAADGSILLPLDRAAMVPALERALADGINALAICLMHGWAWPAHEQALAELALRLGFAQVSTGSQVSPLIKYVPRGNTALADAYLSPVLRLHVDAVAAGLPPGSRLLFMQSSGGLTAAASFRGKDAILSGPAGGIIGMAKTAAPLGYAKLIGFDMGGTSTDVSHHAGTAPQPGFDSSVAGIAIRAPMLAIHTVAAGGGSICRFADGRLQVGPQSAGALPGPAAYGRGGPLTITDCNLALGRVQPDRFPAVFGASGRDPIRPDLARAALDALAVEVARETGQATDPLALAEGLVAIANAHMASAIRHISIARGHDPAEHALVAFGGAGGQHACALADALGIGSILVHPMAGLLSALGIGLADLVATREATVALPFDSGLDAAAQPLADWLGGQAMDDLAARQLPMGAASVTLTAHVRYAGSDTALAVPFGPADAMRAAFEDAHRARFGFLTPEAPLLLDMLSAVASASPIGAGGGPLTSAPAPAPSAEPVLRPVRFDGATHQAAIIDRDTLGHGARVIGPAVICDPSATTVIAPGWQAEVAADATLVLTRPSPPPAAPGRAAADSAAAVDPIRLELFHALFMGIATEMGVALQASARSVNIKERLDFSCAIFDGAGNLVANAPHIPVHLGSMGASIRAVLAARTGDGRGIRPGDAYVLNAPWNGGTHLPDITVVRPCFLDGSTSPDFFVAARGHHADIGGITPGSMPSDSLSIADEGVLIDNMLLVDEGRFREAEMRALLASGPHPARNPDQNIGDLVAQVAACQRGADALAEAAAKHGAGTLLAYMRHIQDNAAAAVARLIPTLPDGQCSVPLDNGARIQVRVRVDREAPHLTVDFAGTSAQQPGNFNAPATIARAALLYVLRCLVGAPIPLNDGALRHVTLLIPPGSMLDARPPAAVVAGNVETSQLVTDALFAAFGAMAASQGTMNNLTFGNARHQYYETIAGGAGAGPDHPGASAVQTHMTNSRLTDPEILETRLPVRVEHFAIRRGSGGGGRNRGGDGVIRRLRFLEAMTVSILSSRRRHRPFGLAGGGDALAGENRLIRADGRSEALDASARVEVNPGDAIAIATPGGGGFGAA